MEVKNFSWWQHPHSHQVDSRLNEYVLEGSVAYEIDGREEWFLFEDGTGLFLTANNGEVIICDSNSKEFKEMVEYLHREEWVDTVLDQMENLWEYTLIDEFDIPDDHDTPEICDAAYEWLPYVLPKTYAKVFPDAELIRKLTISFFIDQTDPQTINFDQ